MSEPLRVLSSGDRRTNAEGIALIKQWEGLRLHAYPDPASALHRAAPGERWGEKSAEDILQTLPANVRSLSGEPWTIGYGHTKTARPGLEITEGQAEKLLRDDLRVFERLVIRHVKVPLSDNEFAALVSFTFNVGPGKKGVKDGFVTLASGRPSTLLRKLNEGDYEGALDEFRKWNKAGGKVVRGLTNRRAAEAGLFVRGSFVASQSVEPEAPISDQPILNRPGGKAAVVGTATVAGTAIMDAADKLSSVGDGTMATSLTITLTLAGLGFVLYAIVKRK